MTSPPQDLRTHESGAHSAGKVQQLRETISELARVKEIGIPAERRMSPAGVRGGAIGTPTSTELRYPLIRDVMTMERPCELFAGVLRPSSRTRKPAYIRNQLHFVRPE